jgi:regulator of replication initiation timing
MKNKIKIREEWRKLNLEIQNIQKVITLNTKAGQKFSEEYLQWVKEKIQYRDNLTNII